MGMDLNVLIGGEAGDGVRQAGYLLGKAFVRGGLTVVSVFDYPSLIRGGRNLHLVRVSDSEVSAPRRGVDALVALNGDILGSFGGEVRPGGPVVFDSDASAGAEPPGRAAAYPIPATSWAREAGARRVVRNSAALGALLGALGYDLDLLLSVMGDEFPPEVYRVNAALARRGYELAARNPLPEGMRVEPVGGRGDRVLITGNEACALGALAGGMRFYAAYPMTPASPILHYLAGVQREAGIGVVQTESEIAAVVMATGAAYAGVRAATGTSGGGFSLMVEGLGQAGATETPLVIFLVQRPGPSTGLPTYTSQGDLLFAITASQGEFPRAVLAPADPEEAFYLSAEAFNIAERFQIPVIVITDKHLAESYFTVRAPDPSRVEVDRGELISGEWRGPGEYLRYALTESGISPRALPGTRGAIVKQNSSEHNERGWAEENPDTARAMTEKRLRKLLGVREALRGRSLEVVGDPDPEVTLVGWGSTRGAVLEAAARLRERGRRVRFVRFVVLWPFPSEEAQRALSNAGEIYSVENNATGQLARLLRMETGIGVDGTVLRYDGRPITHEDVLEGMGEAI